MSRCIRCAGNNTKRIIKHLTFQLTTTPLRGFSFVFFSCFLISLFPIWVSFFNFHLQLILFICCADRDLLLPTKQCFVRSERHPIFHDNL
jgi:hypothetical protein